MRSLIWALVWVLIAACGDSGDEPPPPVPPTVSAMTPTSGAYGTMLSISGSGFDATTKVTFAGSPYIDPVAASGELASDTALTTRYPFPASGAVTVETAGGTATAGAFTPASSWTPGTAFASEAPLRARAIGDAIGVLMETPTLAPVLDIFGGSSEGSYPLDPGLGGLPAGDLVIDDAGRPELLAITGSAAFVAIEIANGTATELQTGVTGARFVAAARDASGVFVWLSVDAGLVRLRPGSAAWVMDDGPIQPLGTPLGAAVAADGTLVYAYAASSTCLSSDDLPEPCYELHATAAEPAGSGYPDDEDADHPIAFDEILDATVQLSADGARVLVTADVVYQGEQDTKVRERGSDGTWVDESTCLSAACAFDGNALAELDSSDAGVELVSDVDGSASPQELGMWPAQADALVFDGSGAVRPIVEVSGQLWAPTAAP